MFKQKQPTQYNQRKKTEELMQLDTNILAQHPSNTNLSPLPHVIAPLDQRIAETVRNWICDVYSDIDNPRLPLNITVKMVKPTASIEQKYPNGILLEGSVPREIFNRALKSRAYLAANPEIKSVLENLTENYPKTVEYEERIDTANKKSCILSVDISQNNDIAIDFLVESIKDIATQIKDFAENALSSPFLLEAQISIGSDSKRDDRPVVYQPKATLSAANLKEEDIDPLKKGLAIIKENCPSTHSSPTYSIRNYTLGTTKTTQQTFDIERNDDLIHIHRNTKTTEVSFADLIKESITTPDE